MTEKIRPLSDLADLLSRTNRGERTVVHCHGVFDLLHPGHLRHFAAAKKEGDILVVTITPDRHVNKGPGRPVFTEHLRAEAIASLGIVDYVAINEWPTAVEAIALLQPDVYAKGREYANASDDLTGKIVEEENAVRGAGGRIHFTDDITFSSSKLLNEHFDLLNADARSFLTDFAKNHDAASVIDALRNLKNLRVVVIGDTIIDEYHSCTVIGRASKTAAINARFIEAESFAGGALAVANHVAGFCDHVQLVTCLGEQETRQDFIEAHLKPNIDPTFLTVPGRTTTVKRRFIDAFRYQKMFEVSFLDDKPLPEASVAELNTHLETMLSDADLVIVADFGHGMLGASTIALLGEKAKYLAVNTQTNSANMGYNPVTKYPRADYICLDQEEIRLAYHDRFGPLLPLIEHLADRTGASTVTVTRGHYGSTTLRRNQPPVDTPVFSTEVIDTIGAGDAYFAVTAPCAAAGLPPDVIGFIGNAVGAMAIRILGNRESIEPVALQKFITTLLK